ncbi:MAG: hypothetical protein ACRDHV_02255 [Actinomycetota bacterium]
MRRTRLTAIAAFALALGLLAPAWAAEFSPTISFDLSTKKIKANPEVGVIVEQEQDEEELATVKLKFPKGYKLAKDGKLQNGEQLGEGQIRIDAGPRCNGQGPISAPVTVPVNIVERNRTTKEVADGVKAVYVVDLRPVTTIDLLVRGSAKKGWTLTGAIPPNNYTCPPFTFDASIFKKAEATGTKIIRNPSKPGKYTLKATFTGIEGSKSTTKKTVKIKK